MASDETINKMIHAIMDKRKQLGIPDWGLVPIEDVIDRINKHGEKNSNGKKPAASSPNPDRNDRAKSIPPSPAAKPIPPSPAAKPNSTPDKQP